MNLRRLGKSRLELVAGLCIVLSFSFVAVAAPRLSPVQGTQDRFGQPIPPEVRIVSS